jgi:ATP-dependent phosphoenolpyruvate carboxykinase
LVENVGFINGTNLIDFGFKGITENTRVSYPLHFISNAMEPSIGGLPKNIFFLTCDAYGVLPPISKLSPGQAMYQFISGYTAKVAGTEAGVTEPTTTFSACFGAPFLIRRALNQVKCLSLANCSFRLTASFSVIGFSFILYTHSVSHSVGNVKL